MDTKGVNSCNQKNSKVKTEDGEILTAKRHIHASLEQRLNVVHRLRFQHKIKTLCRVLRVNRSTCYKHFSSPEKRLGVNKLTILLQREYGLKIGQTRVRRLIKSTSGDFKNLLKLKFNPDEPRGCW